MIYELRSYDIDPPVLEHYLALVNERVVPLLVEQFGFRLIGFWRTTAGSADATNSPTNVHWMIAWESEDEMLERWEQAKATEEWAASWRGQPKFHLKVQRTLLQAIPISPLQ